MPIDVITGQPGACKTLYMMQLLVEAAAKAERPIYAAGINGLQPGLATELANPKDWNEIDPAAAPTCNCPASTQPHGHVIPDGSLIFVDEAWRWFGHLHDAARQATPKYVLDLAIHRHRGLDFVWTTQLSNQLFPFVRGLIGTHTHMVRVFGTSLSTQYAWGELVEDVKSTTQRDKALMTRWFQRKDLFDKYKSASLHTVQSRVPKRLWLLPVGLVVTVLLGVMGFKAIFNPKTYQDEKVLAAAAEAKAKPPAPEASEKRKEMPKTATEWYVALTPTVPGIAFTAPLYAETLKVQSYPQIFCAITGAEYQDRLSSKCGCITEQGTKPTEIADSMCRVLALNGYYDPFKPQGKRAEAAPKFVPPPVLPSEAVLSESFSVQRPLAPGAIASP